MPKPALPAPVEELLAQPNHATISSLRPDGQPVSVPTWYLYENGRILVVQGRVVEWVDDDHLVDVDRIARQYTGQPYGVRNRQRVSAWIEIDRWHAWGRLKNVR